MYMTNAKILHLVPKATYIPLTRVWDFALADAKNLRYLTQDIFFALSNAKVRSFALGDAKVPNVNGFASQWNIGLNVYIPPGDFWWRFDRQRNRFCVGNISNIFFAPPPMFLLKSVITIMEHDHKCTSLQLNNIIIEYRLFVLLVHFTCVHSQKRRQSVVEYSLKVRLHPSGAATRNSRFLTMQHKVFIIFIST